MKKGLFFVLSLMITMAPSILYGAIVYGRIYDSETGESLIGANIFDENCNIGTSTNVFGQYSLELANGIHYLSFSYIGYKGQRFTIDSKRDTFLNIELKPDYELKEIIVTNNNTKFKSIKATGNLLNELSGMPMPLSEPDILKCIQGQAGVQSGIAGTSNLYVRGGSSDQNLYLLDGVPIYNASHAFGFLSIFQPEILKDVRFYKDAFPAKYGGRISSVVDLTAKDGDIQNIHGSISLGLLSSRIQCEGPIIKNRISFNLAARRSYIDWIIKPFLDEGDDAGFSMYDIYAKLRYKITDRCDVTAMYYQGKDRIKYANGYVSNYYDATEFGSKDEADLNWGNRLGSIHINHIIRPQIRGSYRLSYSGYESVSHTSIYEKVKYANNVEESRNKNQYISKINHLGFDSDIEYSPNNTTKLRIGIHGAKTQFCPNAQYSESGSTNMSTTRNKIQFGKNEANELACYGETEFQSLEQIETIIGIRLSSYNTQGKYRLYLLPRCTFKYTPCKIISLTASYAAMEQAHFLLASSELNMPGDFWACSTKRIPPIQGHHTSFVAGINCAKNMTLNISPFYKYIKNVVEYKDGHSCLSGTYDWENDISIGQNKIWGIENSLNKRFKKSIISASYAWMQSVREFSRGDVNEGRKFPYRFGRNHILKLSWNSHISARIELHTDWHFESGTYISVPSGYTMALYPTIDNDATSAWRESNLTKEHQTMILDYRSRNNYKLPPTHGLNIGLRLIRKHKIGTGYWDFSIMNAYNHKNPDIAIVNNKKMADGKSYIQIEKMTIIPIVPSCSYTFKF